MVVPVIRAVIESERFAGSQKLVLATLAAYADADGTNIFPAIDTVARKCGFDRRTVQRHLRSLEDDGVMVKVAEARQHRPAKYRIDMAALGVTPAPPLNDPRGGRIAPRGGTRACQGRHQRRPTSQDQPKTCAPPAAPPMAAAGACRLPETVGASYRRDAAVAVEGGKVKVTVPTKFIREYLAENHRAEIAAAFAVEPDAVEFIN